MAMYVYGNMFEQSYMAEKGVMKRAIPIAILYFIEFVRVTFSSDIVAVFSTSSYFSVLRISFKPC